MRQWGPLLSLVATILPPYMPDLLWPLEMALAPILVVPGLFVAAILGLGAMAISWMVWDQPWLPQISPGPVMAAMVVPPSMRPMIAGADQL